MPDWYGFSISGYANPQAWETALTQADKWKFNAHRLHFYFKTSTGSLIPLAALCSQLDSCLAVIANHGAKAVLDLHNWGPPTGSMNVLIGSGGWFTNWLALIQRFKNDPRVLAWEIFNEAFNQYLDPSYGGDGTTTKTPANIEGLMKAQFDLSVKIRQIDPNRPIVWSPNYSTSTTRYTPLSSPVTKTNYTTLIQNIILTEHPYDYGSQTTWSALRAILNNRIQNAKTDQTAYPIWIGEIECHSPPNGGSRPALEAQYVSEVLKAAQLNQWGFAIWRCPDMDDKVNKADAVIAQSGYGSR